MKNTIHFFLLAALFFSACSNDGVDFISESNLKGKVFGQDFVAAQGYAEISRGEFVKIVLTSTEVNCNSEAFNLPLYLSVAVPDRKGFHKNVLATFGKSGEDPVKEINALVEIVEVNENEVLGRIRSDSSSKNNVEGTFTVNICTR